MRRIVLFLVVGTLMATMAGVGALSGFAQVDGAIDTGEAQYEEEEGAIDTGATPAEEPPPAVEEEEPVVLCAPGWNMEWYQWYGPEGGWWYFWWYQWCYDLEDERWFREYDGWDWGPPIF